MLGHPTLELEPVVIGTQGEPKIATILTIGTDPPSPTNTLTSLSLSTLNVNERPPDQPLGHLKVSQCIGGTPVDFDLCIDL